MKVNRETANANCVHEGGRLVDSEFDLLRKKTNMLVEAEVIYWVELRRVWNTSEFEWTDGTIVDWNDWKTNNPKDDLDCMGIEGKNGKLVSLECNAKNSVICSIGK